MKITAWSIYKIILYFSCAYCFNCDGIQVSVDYEKCKKKKKRETIYTEIIFLIFMFIFADVKLFAIFFFFKNSKLFILELVQWNRLFCMSDLPGLLHKFRFLQGSWIHSHRSRLCHLSQIRWHWLNADPSMTFGICLQPKKTKKKKQKR